MTNEFKKITNTSETRYVLETATGGATSAGAVATVPGSLGKVQKRGNVLAQEKKETPKPRNFVAKNAKMGGAGQHKDKKKAEKQGEVKHKKPLAESSYAEDLAKQVFDANPNIKDENAVLDAAWPIAVKDLGNKRAMSVFNYDEDFPSDLVSVYGWLQKGTSEGVSDLSYDAQSLITKLRRDVEEKRLQPTPEAVLAAARELAGDMDFAPQLLVKQVLGKEVLENPNDGKEDNFTIDDIKRLEKIRDLETLKAQAKELIKGKPVRRMKPEKISWFYNHIDTLRNPLAVIKMMYDLMLAGEGNKVIGSKNSMSANSYRSRFGEQGVAEGFNGEYDDEAGMAHTNLLTSARAVMGLLKTIDDKDNLPEWVQEKIAKAEMMLVGVWDYLQSQKEQGIDPQVEGYGRYDRRDAYQRDYDSSVSGMDRSNNHRDDERHDLDPSDWYIVKDGKMYKTSVYPRQEQEALSRGYSRTREEAKSKADNVAEGVDPYFESLNAKVEELAKK